MKNIIVIIIFLFISFFSGAIVPVPIAVSCENSFDISGNDKFQMSAPTPNPVYDFATIFFKIPVEENAEIALYNFTGLKIKSINVSGMESSVVLDCTDLDAGVYFVCLIYQGRNVDSKKLVKK